MVPVELFCGPIWQQLAWTLLHFVWQGFLVMAAVAVSGMAVSPCPGRKPARPGFARVGGHGTLPRGHLSRCYFFP